jgi:hypothetical protein
MLRLDQLAVDHGPAAAAEELCELAVDEREPPFVETDWDVRHNIGSALTER